VSEHSTNEHSANEHGVSEIFDPSAWSLVEGFDFTDITYHRSTLDGPAKGTVRIAFNRP